MIRSLFAHVLALIGFALLTACGAVGPDGPPVATQDEIDALEEGILKLGPDVDPGEAARAAEIAFRYTHQLAIEYEITDGPLIHNTKVNAGLRPRGLCWHWAEDMEKRLLAENFQTLDMHRAIANADSRILIDHSTAIISAKGDDFDEGVVLDPWRFGGRLFWAPLVEDTRYTWVSREDVLDARLRQLIAEGKVPASARLQLAPFPSPGG